MQFGRLTKRSEFLAARRGRRLNGPHFFVEARARDDAEAPRLGLTVTKKVGNAVERNRIRRRLREAVRTGAKLGMVPGFDYVIVARRDVIDLPFAALVTELSRSFAKVRTTKVKPPEGHERRAGARPQRS